LKIVTGPIFDDGLGAPVHVPFLVHWRAARSERDRATLIAYDA